MDNFLVRWGGRAEVEGRLAELHALYKDAFAGPPYFETDNTPEKFRAILQKGLAAGESGVLLCLRQPDLALAGFLVGYGLGREEEVCSLLTDHGCLPGPADRGVFLAEVCTHPRFRRQGVATGLLRRLVLARRGACAYFLARTHVDNLASQNLFAKLGFKIIPGPIQRFERDDCQRGKWFDRRLFLLLP